MDHRPSLLDPCIKMHVMPQYAFKASLAFSILIAAIHHHLNMHIRMAERYHSLSFFRGFIMQLLPIQLSGNKAEIFMQIAQFISDTFRVVEMHRRFSSGLWRFLQSSRITSYSPLSLDRKTMYMDQSI